MEYLFLYLSSIVVTFLIGLHMYGLKDMRDNPFKTLLVTIVVFLLFLALHALFPTRPI